MKKQKLITIPLKFKKISIANLSYTKGGKDDISIDSVCCSKPPVCEPTLTTRPDSINPYNDKENENG